MRKFFLAIALVLFVSVTLAESPTGIYLRNVGSVVEVTALIRNDKLDTLEPYGSGSAVFVDTKGALLTANHVVKKSRVCLVEIGKDMVRYYVEARDPKNDLALLRPANKKVHSSPVTLGVMVFPGEKVYAVGYPADLGKMFTTGFVAGKDGKKLIVSCSIAAGSSGGALFNNSGFLVGITQSYLARSSSLSWQGFTNAAYIPEIRKFLYKHL